MNTMMLPLLLLCPRPSLLAAAASAVRGSFDGFPQGPPNAGHCDPCFAPSTQVLQLTGWALDTSLAGGGVPPVRVAIAIDGKPVLNVTADLPRPDLVKAHIAPNPDHGFLVTVPPELASSLRTGRHTITATAEGTALASPCHSFACATEDFQYIENGHIRLGADMTRGGSIG
jgi:hypothetical protein